MYRTGPPVPYPETGIFSLSGPDRIPGIFPPLPITEVDYWGSMTYGWIEKSESYPDSHVEEGLNRFIG